MSDATVRRVVRDKIAVAGCPEIGSVQSRSRTGLTKYATCAPSQSRLTKCCIGLPMSARAGSSFTPRTLPSGGMSGTRWPRHTRPQTSYGPQRTDTGPDPRDRSRDAAHFAELREKGKAQLDARAKAREKTLEKKRANLCEARAVQASAAAKKKAKGPEATWRARHAHTPESL
jgi:hypothetical protein